MLKTKDGIITGIDFDLETFGEYGSDSPSIRFLVTITVNDKTIELIPAHHATYGSSIGVDEIGTLVSDLLNEPELENMTMGQVLTEHFLSHCYMGTMVSVDGGPHFLHAQTLHPVTEYASKLDIENTANNIPDLEISQFANAIPYIVKELVDEEDLLTGEYGVGMIDGDFTHFKLDEYLTKLING